MHTFLTGIAIAALIAISMAGPANAQMFGKGNGLVNEAAHALDREKWDRGVGLARQALRSGSLTPTNIPAALNNLCIGLTGQGHYEEALETCNRAIGKKPREWSFYNNRANIHYYQEKYDRALSDYYKALTFSPGDDVLITNISLTLRTRKKAAERIGEQGKVERQS
ncbi:MAG: tetratricopeptide repeat protein [Alphaproteobacteria bacterium]|nr:tetratricopeptide repeat protein [Alphaproteobacteria bacterium]